MLSTECFLGSGWSWNYTDCKENICGKCSDIIIRQGSENLCESQWIYYCRNYTVYSVYSPYIPYCSLYISLGAEKENLFNNQELLWLMIIFFILVT